ncbi:MAG: DUF5131 family protein [Phycisphaerae bacterium]|nr:DUF5131 family protein [Phycisphaerae bacterium]
MNFEQMKQAGRYWQKAWQLVDGCTKVSPACDNCWSEAMAKRFHKFALIKSYNWKGLIKFRHGNLDLPLHTRKPTVFSIWNDLWHSEVPYTFFTDAMVTVEKCPQHIFLGLTKRAERITECFKDICPPKNLWLGVTAENQQYANERIPILLQIPAAHKFISFEPLISTIDLLEWNKIGNTPIATEEGITAKRNSGVVRNNTSCGKLYSQGEKLGISSLSLCIVGAETGPNARYCPREWIESVVEQCKAAGVPVWVKAYHKGTKDHFKIIHNFTDLPESIRKRELPFAIDKK